MAGTGKGQEDELLTTFLNTAYGLDMKYVPFRGGGRVAKELAGKNANSTVNNPSEQLGFYEAGKTRPLAAFTPERLELFGDAPTFVELDQDFVYFMQRSVVGAPGMSDEAAAFYQDLFAKVFASDEWQTYRREKRPVRRPHLRRRAEGLLDARARHPRGDAEGDRRDLALPPSLSPSDKALREAGANAPASRCVALMPGSNQARESHQLPAADADLRAVTRRTPSSRFDVVSTTPSAARTRSFRSVRLVTAAPPRPRDESW